MFSVTLRPELVDTAISAVTKEEALRKMAQILYRNGYVKESYAEAVQKREEVFATGLITETIGVAIPHTDIEHVNKAGIAVGILEKPVKFGVMADPGNFVEVKAIFMLAITEPNAQLALLEELVNLFQDNELLTRIAATKEAERITSMVNDFFTQKKA